MLGEGKDPKVSSAPERVEPVADIPEGRWVETPASQAPVRAEGTEMAVLVLDRRKKPLMPCSERRARVLLARGRARIHRIVPFMIRLVDRLQEDSTLQPLRLQADPAVGMA